MFREKEMAEVIFGLFDFFDEEDYEDFESTELLSNLSERMHEICLGLRDEVVVPYEYQLDDTMEALFRYRGKELFGQRACLLIAEPQIEVPDFVHLSIDKELWLLEDMSLAIVHCVHSELRESMPLYKSAYRSIATTEPERDDLFFSPDVLAEALEWAAERYDEDSATVYEI